MIKGQIIIITGTSGAGKSTTAQAWARHADKCYLTFGFDLLVSFLIAAKFTNFGERAEDFFYDIRAGRAWRLVPRACRRYRRCTR